MKARPINIRPLDSRDLTAVLALNQGALDGVGPLDAERLEWLVGLADRSLVADVDGDIAGFVITFAPGAAYDSPNYAWYEQYFSSRDGIDYLYLDRIVVAPDHRRTGVGSQLYDAIEGGLPVALEVNCKPPNVASLAFHAARGYEEVGRLPQRNGKTVALLVKPAA